MVRGRITDQGISFRHIRNRARDFDSQSLAASARNVVAIVVPLVKAWTFSHRADRVRAHVARTSVTTPHAGGVPMIKQGLAKAGIVLSLVVAAAAAAHAQSVIAINRGTFVVDDMRDNSFAIAGNHGFSVEGSINLASAAYDIIEQCWLPECAPGTVLDLSDSWGGSDVSALERFRGKTPDDASNDEFGRFLAVSASVTLPPIADGPVTVSVPFDFTGTFIFPLDGQSTGVTLLGGGVATLTLVPLAEDPRFWHIQQIVFDFRPVNRR
jgi:hypothetical protein